MMPVHSKSERRFVKSTQNTEGRPGSHCEHLINSVARMCQSDGGRWWLVNSGNEETGVKGVTLSSALPTGTWGREEIRVLMALNIWIVLLVPLVLILC